MVCVDGAVAQHAQKHSGGTARKVNGGFVGCVLPWAVFCTIDRMSPSGQGTLQVAIGYRADLRGTRQTLGARSVLESLKVVLHQDGTAFKFHDHTALVRTCRRRSINVLLMRKRTLREQEQESSKRHHHAHFQQQLKRIQKEPCVCHSPCCSPCSDRQASTISPPAHLRPALPSSTHIATT